MRSDADGSVSFNGLYLAGSDILLTHTHTQGTWRNLHLLSFILRAREACRKPCKQRALASSLCSFYHTLLPHRTKGIQARFNPIK